MMQRRTAHTKLTIEISTGMICVVSSGEMSIRFLFWGLGNDWVSPWGDTQSLPLLWARWFVRLGDFALGFANWLAEVLEIHISVEPKSNPHLGFTALPCANWERHSNRRLFSMALFGPLFNVLPLRFALAEISEGLPKIFVPKLLFPRSPNYFPSDFSPSKRILKNF